MRDSTVSYVPADQHRAYVLDAGLSQIHEGWDQKHAEDRSAALANLSKLPAKPLSRALDRRDRGSKDNRHLLNQIVASKGGGPNLSAPVSRTASTAASAWTPGINVGASGISAMASSTSKALAKGVNEIIPTALEASKGLANAVYANAASALSSTASTAVSALTSVGNAGASGMGKVVSSISSVGAKNAHAAQKVGLEKSKKPGMDTADASRRGANERKNASRFWLPPLLQAA